MSSAWIAAFAALAFVTLTTAVVVLGLLRRAVAVLEQVQGGNDAAGKGAPSGTALEPFELRDDDGAGVVSDELIARGPTIFLLLEEWCDPCVALAEELAMKEVGESVDGVQLVAVVGQAHERRRLALPASMRIFYPADERVVEAFRWRASPLAFLVDETGLVLDRLVPNGVGQLQVLARRSAGTGLRQLQRLM
jgi:hypothetical protein